MNDPLMDTVPTTLDEAVTLLYNSLTDKERQAATGEMSHFGFGMGIRNNWSLWDTDTILSKWFQNNLGLCHGDDLSGCIIYALRAKIDGQPFDQADFAAKCKVHWAAWGGDPMDKLNG